MQKQILFEPGNYYYLRSQSIAQEIAFPNEVNYSFFLQRCCDYFLSNAETLSFCLLPNQFHLLFKIRSTEKFIKEFDSDNTIFSTRMASNFGKVISSYTQSFNHYNDRLGSLFIRPYKRSLISDHEQLMDLIKHIHRLPVDFGLTDHPAKWKHSSYPLIINKRASFIHTSDIVSSLSALKKFELFHEIPSEFKPEFQTPPLTIPVYKAA